MLKQMLERGFTLIELLVVIAIIGILASVVLASLNDARDSGEDAAIKQQLSSTRAEAELSYDKNNRSYGSVCNDIGDLYTSLPGVVGTDKQCANADDSYAVAAVLNNGDFFCVDHTGDTSTSSSLIASSATECP